VVVKVRRPGVLDTIELDLGLLDRTARRAARVSRLARRYDLPGLARRFAETLRAECDYRLEGRNAEAIARALGQLPDVVVPQVDWQHTCESVLTEGRVEGVKIDDLDALERMGVDRAAVAVTFADLYLAMVFGDGFFHADPHPGNVFVDADGTVGLVDFGMTGRVEPATGTALGGVLVALVATDAHGMADALLGLGMATRTVDRPRLERDLGALLADYAHRPLDQLPVAEVLGRVMAVVRRHRLRLPPDLALLVKTVMMCEGVALRLDPGFLLVPRLLPYAARLTGGGPDAPPGA
jgi:ubiquinone biosynthesis protein